MKLAISAANLRAMEAHLEAAYPNEGAGLLLGESADDEKRVAAILPLANQWDQGGQSNRFLLGPQAMLDGEREAARRGLDVIGVFHSHPDHPAEPSGFDRDWALPWYSYVITTVAGGAAGVSRAWRLRDDRSAYDEERLRVFEDA